MIQDLKSEKDCKMINFGALGKAIRIGANSYATINEAGASVKFYAPTVDVTIAIGRNHVANLIMDKEAWEALKGGQKVHITTLKEFQNGFIKPTRKSAKKKSTKPSKSNKAGGKK